MCVCNYQILCVDLFLHINIYVDICWSRPVVHAVFTTVCQDTEILTSHQPKLMFMQLMGTR